MPIQIREVREDELDVVLALNNAAGPSILPLTEAQLRFGFEEAAYFRVAESAGRIVGFLIAYDENSRYASSNYRWFRSRYPQFLYIDRVVIASAQRGGGVGRIFYADVTSFAEVRTPLLTCEVFLEPRNDTALVFHGTYGFQEVGQRVMDENGLRVSMLVKELGCYSWVKTRWLEGPGLPDLPWLSERPHRTASAGEVA
ncbi:MAG TPA: GNAT family N-acetyltransferase [Chiayiivirga sp.]|nr:GNAT family N-acetyltransferase [Chiayiivirga sp.]